MAKEYHLISINLKAKTQDRLIFKSIEDALIAFKENPNCVLHLGFEFTDGVLERIWKLNNQGEWMTPVEKQ